jgi:hydroxymethylpyrimidine pyrophosphatase-like HAD family hydrolase
MCERKCTIFCDIDGTLFHYRKYGTYENTPIIKIQETVNIINKAYNDGHHIILTTARPEHTRTLTHDELNTNNVKYHTLIMGMARGARILINDNEHAGIDKAYAFCVERNKTLNKDDESTFHALLNT